MATRAAVRLVVGKLALVATLSLASVACGAHDRGDHPSTPSPPDAGAPEGGIPGDGGAAGDGSMPGEGGACSVADAASFAPAVLSPPAGTTLKATSVDLRWSPGADVTQVIVGTTPGAADVYRSPPLVAGTTSLTVTGLPLTGQTLFVELRSRIGSACSATRTEYVASMRKGLCVIADFADARLEDWTGPGARSVADVRAQLDLMQEHWDFLSRGVEKTRWDIVRVALDQSSTATAFPGWFEYRQAVATRLAALVPVEDYDVNRDGVFDGVFVIASSNGAEFDYLVGGTARVGGANMFVDAQSSQSVREQQTGNFNHEFAHCLGLPDLYGEFSTLADLSLMDSSWNFPREDFCAFDRVKMGWAKPRVLTASARNVVLQSAHDHLDVVKVELSDPDEYFLLEYKRKPTTGFGSAGRPFDGVVVYHVLEGSSQGTNPPLLKVEPADGAIAVGPADLVDLFYPGNPAMQLPRVIRSYIGDIPVVQIDAVRWAGAAIEIDLQLIAGAADPANLLANPGFEDGATSWSTGAFRPEPELVSFSVESPGRNSSLAAVIDAPVQPNDAEWRQHVFGLVPGASYRLCGWLKGDAIVPHEGATVGGSVGVSGTFTQSSAGFGSFDWTRRCVVFPTAIPEGDVGCRLGGFGSVVTGRLRCDDLTLARLFPAF